jgi:hypothetical protein
LAFAVQSNPISIVAVGEAAQCTTFAINATHMHTSSRCIHTRIKLTKDQYKLIATLRANLTAVINAWDIDLALPGSERLGRS